MREDTYPAYAAADAVYAGWPAFHLTEEIAEKLKKDKAALIVKGKHLTKPLNSLKSRTPSAFCTNEERKRCGFWQIDTVHHCGQTTTGHYVHTLTATDVLPVG
jgi:hypothetical protein